MADITRRLRYVCAAILVAATTAACDTEAPFAPELPPAVGFRVDGGVLKLWTGTPCEGVIGMTLSFDVGTSKSEDQVWSAPKPGVRLDRMDVIGPAPDPDGRLQIKEPLPAQYDWTKAEWLNFAVQGPEAWGARVEVARILRESPEHPPESYLFGSSGWMAEADVQRENRKSFLTICSPGPE